MKNKYVLFVFGVVLLILLIYTSIRTKEVNRFRDVDYYYNASTVREIYETHPEIFTFTDDNKSIITVYELLSGQNDYDFDLIHDEDGNECIGYYIIEKDLDNNIKIDPSHICDMIDY